MNTALKIMILIPSVILIASILLQSGKNAGLSGSIAGGAETIWGKNKGRSYEGVLSKITAISAIAFVICALILAVIQK